MPHTDTVIIGAGHAGLALSHQLTDRRIPHVILDRGEVGQRWRTARWESFRLITPNWMSRLPGWSYAGPDPDGFMTADEFVSYLSRYAEWFGAPVESHTVVTRVERRGECFAVHTDRGVWKARNVVVATGYHSAARVPELAAGLAPDVAQITPSGYRSPASLPDGGVLVVGASASGIQIADELARSGRRVVLAVGRHTRMPRRYRDRDILWWLDRIGSLDRTIDELPEAVRAADDPSLQLTGSAPRRRLDLGVVQEAGVRLTGRLLAVRGTVAEFADDLSDTMAAAERRLCRVLGDIDDFFAASPGFTTAESDPPPVIPTPATPSQVDLGRAGIGAVVWATGYRPSYPWLKVPVLDGDGRIMHRRGVTDVPGMYAIGLRFQYRRTSTFIDGARHDAAYLADHIAAHRGLRVSV